MGVQKALAPRSDGIGFIIHDACVKRPLLERREYIFNEACVANAMVEADLVALRAKGLLVALLETRFTLGNHFEIFAQFSQNLWGANLHALPLCSKKGTPLRRYLDI